MRGPALALLVALVAGCTEAAPEDWAGVTATPPPATKGATTSASAPATATPTAPPPEPTQCQSQRTATRASEPTWLLNTSYGDIRITLFCDKTPITAQNIVTLTEREFYDGILFHRVVDGFVIQAGDPQTRDESLRASWGRGGSGTTIVDEFYCADGSVNHDYPGFCASGLGLLHTSAGVVSMANAGRAQTGTSQFFITTASARQLDGKHAIFGRVADHPSLDVALAIGDAPTNAPYADTPREPITIHRATIEWS